MHTALSQAMELILTADRELMNIMSVTARMSLSSSLIALLLGVPMGIWLGAYRFPGQKFVFLLSIMADEDVDEMLALLLPLAKRFVTVAAHTPRAMPAETLAEQIRARGGRAEPASTIEAGVARAVALGGTGPVCALGTLYFSGDVREAFAKLNQ